MRRAYLVVATVFFCAQATAQTVTIDLDRLSKVSYCLGADTEFQKIMSQFPDECIVNYKDPTEELKRAREALCASRRNSDAELKRKIDLYKLYIIIRIDVGSAAFTSTVALSDGKADVSRCSAATTMLSATGGACPNPVPFEMKAFDEQQSCMERNIPPACRRLRGCANLDIP